MVRDEKVERNQINTQEMENNKQKLGCVCVCVIFSFFILVYFHDYLQEIHFRINILAYVISIFCIIG